MCDVIMLEADERTTRNGALVLADLRRRRRRNGRIPQEDVVGGQHDGGRRHGGHVRAHGQHAHDLGRLLRLALLDGLQCLLVGHLGRRCVRHAGLLLVGKSISRLEAAQSE